MVKSQLVVLLIGIFLISLTTSIFVEDDDDVLLTVEDITEYLTAKRNGPVALENYEKRGAKIGSKLPSGLSISVSNQSYSRWRKVTAMHVFP